MGKFDKAPCSWEGALDVTLKLRSCVRRGVCSPSRLAMSTWGMIWGTAAETVASASLTLTALKACATAARGLWFPSAAAAAWLLACASLRHQLPMHEAEKCFESVKRRWPGDAVQITACAMAAWHLSRCSLPNGAQRRVQDDGNEHD